MRIYPDNAHPATTEQVDDFASNSHAAPSAQAIQTPSYSILLHHDGMHYYADVPELPDCSGRGASYSEALHKAETAIATRLQHVKRMDAAPPVLMTPATLAAAFKHWIVERRSDMAASAASEHQRFSAVKLALVNKFGKQSNRELAKRIGLTARDAPTMLSSATAGSGTRTVRCLIALALDDLPSRLWPNRHPKICQVDDEVYLICKKNGTVPAQINEGNFAEQNECSAVAPRSV